MLKKIISGGQTGVDRAALDAALNFNFPCGGFCPRGRKAEDGIISNEYPLQEHHSHNYSQRTLENVLVADATLIIYTNKLRGGTGLTLRLCKDHNKKHLLINAAEHETDKAAKITQNFIQQHKIEILNVAGPRKSQWLEGYEYVYSTFELIFKNYL